MLERFIRDVPDFPKPGIVFKDITPLLANPAALRNTIDTMSQRIRAANVERIIGIESRGFLFGVPVALELGIGFTPVRKPKKLPWKTTSMGYRWATRSWCTRVGGIRPIRGSPVEKIR